MLLYVGFICECEDVMLHLSKHDCLFICLILFLKKCEECVFVLLGFLVENVLHCSLFVLVRRSTFMRSGYLSIFQYMYATIACVLLYSRNYPGILYPSPWTVRYPNPQTLILNCHDVCLPCGPKLQNTPSSSSPQTVPLS